MIKKEEAAPQPQEEIKDEGEDSILQFQNGLDYASREQVTYYQLVAKTMGKLYSIFDGYTEYKIGRTMHQDVKPEHQGGYYVYQSFQEAIFADVPFRQGGLYSAPRTVIQCYCWGEQLDYGKGKLSFEYLLPAQDIGMPKGYISSKAGMRLAFEKLQQEELKQKGKTLKKQEWQK